MMPLDVPISDWLRGLDLPGDVEKDLQAFQQFGQLGTLILVIFLVWRLESPTIRRTLLDLGLAVLIAIVVATLLKTLLGKVRPGHAEVQGFLGPTWMRPLDSPLHDDWHSTASMPSSHATAAAVLAVYLAWIQPRMAWIAVVLAGLVAFVRVQAGAHWPSDVLAGLLLGGVVATVVVHRGWGTRLIDWGWKKVVDSSADPAWPELRNAVQTRQMALNPTQIPWWARISTLIVLGISASTMLILAVV